MRYSEKGEQQTLIDTDYIVSLLKIYPNPEADCIKYTEEQLAMIESGKSSYYPCVSMCCPRHAAKAKGMWANRIKYKISVSKYAYVGNLPINQFLDRATFSKLMQSFRRSLGYKLLPFRYCFSFEIQNNQPHIHFVITSDYSLATKVIREVWFKHLLKQAKIEKGNMTSFLRPVDHANYDANYVVKAGSAPKTHQLPPQGYLHRLIRASQGYGGKKRQD